jgi:hypothetical protein
MRERPHIICHMASSIDGHARGLLLAQVIVGVAPEITTGSVVGDSSVHRSDNIHIEANEARSNDSRCSSLHPVCAMANGTGKSVLNVPTMFGERHV